MALTYFSEPNRIGFLSFSKLFSLAPPLTTSHHPPTSTPSQAPLPLPLPLSYNHPLTKTHSTRLKPLPTYQLRSKHKSSAQSATQRASALSHRHPGEKVRENFDFGRKVQRGCGSEGSEWEVG